MSKRHRETWVVQVGSAFPPQYSNTARGGQIAWMPRVDVLESDRHLLVRIELAGVHTDQVTLSYTSERHALMVRGERTGDLCGRDERYQAHVLEIEEGPFAREIQLPDKEFDLEQAKAKFRCGILTIVVPKRDKATGVFVVESVTIRRI